MGNAPHRSAGDAEAVRGLRAKKSRGGRKKSGKVM